MQCALIMHNALMMRIQTYAAAVCSLINRNGIECKNMHAHETTNMYWNNKPESKLKCNMNWH